MPTRPRRRTRPGAVAVVAVCLALLSPAAAQAVTHPDPHDTLRQQLEEPTLLRHMRAVQENFVCALLNRRG
jgi:hypothetical protein